MTLDAFFDELGPERSAQITAVSLDLGPAFLKSVRAEGHAPQAIVCADPFHLVKLVSEALDEVRRELWNELRRLPDDRWARDFKGSRWALLKNPEDLDEATPQDALVAPGAEHEVRIVDFVSPAMPGQPSHWSPAASCWFSRPWGT